MLRCHRLRLLLTGCINRMKLLFETANNKQKNLSNEIRSPNGGKRQTVCWLFYKDLSVIVNESASHLGLRFIAFKNRIKDHTLHSARSSINFQPLTCNVSTFVKGQNCNVLWKLKLQYLSIMAK